MQNICVRLMYVARYNNRHQSYNIKGGRVETVLTEVRGELRVEKVKEYFIISELSLLFNIIKLC